ncbi:hypothetical protein SAE02_38540 [Skermanella aerolata]|uniref:DUF4214 domain-containing protein n=1 Tax=Skermanella aerolata TaxID=393310 RepID=A0A512DTC6_9PROT|nr:cadherin-like domain-containing protein [Skermanella aerolata]KJB94667.1 hypothetical protein N826_09125 [Skermanella aerolata KACC 11604]GEO39706.1 hypothetical protein SAE02_38540 [Skermanella aerolata]
MTTFETIKSYYENILQRPAADDEANGWASRVESGDFTLQQVREIFISSEEGQHVQDVIRLYQGSFNRVPDQGGLKTWVNSGYSIEDIAAGFTGSEEFLNLYKTNEPTEEFITSLYKNVLGREPDAEGLNNWLNSGMSANTILMRFTESEEFRGEAGAWVGKFLDRAGEGKSVYDGTLYNDAPVAGDAVALPSMEEDGGSVTFSAADLLVNVRDYDADDVSVKSVTVDSASGELVDNGDGTWTFTPAADYNGMVTFDVVVTDGELDATTSATLEVTPVNDAPVAGEPVVLDAMEEDGTITITAEQLLKNVVDVDGDSLSLVVTADSGDLVDNNDGTWTFTPAADFNGTVNFSVTASDGSGEWTETTASLEVTPVNDAPVITGAEETRIGEEMFGISGFGIMAIDPLAVTKTALVTDAEGNFAGGSVRIDVSGKFEFEDKAIFFAEAEGDEIIGKFYLVGTNVVMRAGVAGNDIDTVVGTYKTGFIDKNATSAVDYVAVQDVGETTYALVTLNGNATGEVVTEMLKNVHLGYAADGETDMNVKVTVTDGDGLSADFTRLLDVDGRATLTKDDDDESPYESVEEVELSDRVNHSLAIEEINFDFNGSVMNGATITVTGDNWTDKLGLNAANASIENGQARFILNVNGTYDVSVKTADTETVIGTTASLPKAGDRLIVTLNENATESRVEILLNSLTVDLSTDLGERHFTVVYESAKGPNDLVSTDTVEIQMTRTVVGDFEEVSMAALMAATALSPVIIDSNTRIILSGTQTLDIEQAIEDGKIIVSGEDHLIRLISATPPVTVDISGVTGLDKLGTYSFHNFDADLTISAEQANNTKGTITTGHTLTVTGIENLLGLDLSKLNADEDSIVAELTAATDLTFSGDLGDASLEVTGAGELSVAADLATGKSISYEDGTIIITGFGTSPYNLSDVKAVDGNVKADVSSDLEVNRDAQLGDLELAVAQNATVTLTATQANDRTITGGNIDGNGNKGASVIVTDLTNGIDLSKIVESSPLIGATNATKSDLIVQVTGKEGNAEDGVLKATSLNLGSFIVKIDEGATLKTDSGSVNGKSIQGEGAIIVRAEGPSINADLSKVTVTGDKTLEVGVNLSGQPSLAGGAQIGNFEVVVDQAATFSLTAAQATGKTIDGAASTDVANGGSISITGLGSTAVDFSKITAGAKEGTQSAGSVVATTSADATLTADTKLGTAEIVVGDTYTLTLSAAQANDRVITDAGNSGGLVVTGLAADTDLSKVVFNGSATTVTATVDSSIDITANTTLGEVDLFKVLEGTTLTLSAAQAAALDGINNKLFNVTTTPAVGDVASVVIVGDLDTSLSLVTSAGVSKLDGVKVTFDDNSIVVNTGSTLSIAMGDLAGTQTVSGAGTTAVYNLLGTSDLSKVTTETVNAFVTSNIDISTNTKLSTVDSFTMNDGATLTLKATQVDGIDLLKSGTSGAATIVATSGDEDLDMTGSTANITVNLGSGDDTFTGGSGNDTITGGNGQDIIRGGAGNDTIRLTEGTAAIDKVIFEATNNGNDTIIDFKPEVGGDVLDFSAFSLAGNDNFTTATSAVKVDASAFKVIVVTDAAAADWSNDETIINAALTTPDNIDDNAESIVIINNGTDSRIYHYTDGVTRDPITDAINGGTSDIQLLGTLNGVDASKLVASNFDLTPFVS